MPTDSIAYGIQTFSKNQIWGQLKPTIQALAKSMYSECWYHGYKNYDANIIKAQERIEKILGLKVNITNKKNNSGKLTIEYKDLDQFEFISDLLTKR